MFNKGQGIQGPGSRTQSPEKDPHARPGAGEAGALQDVHLRLSKGLREANDQRHSQGDGHAEPQVIRSHHLKFAWMQKWKSSNCNDVEAWK